MGATFALAAAPALAADWTPDRTITMIVPSTPGAGADTTGRLFAEHLSQALGQTVVVENRGGAGGVTGTSSAARSASDGYTLLLGSDYAFTIYPQLRKPPYDPINDFAPIGLIADLPMVLVVNPDKISATNGKELIELAKKNPGKYTIASAGVGSSHHLAAESFKHQADINLLHVPYRGAAEAMTDVLSGQSDMMFISPATVIPHLKTGKVRAIGASVGERIQALPDVPTLKETVLPDYDIGIWFGFLYPAGTPDHIVKRVNAELQTILKKPEVRKRIFDMGYTPTGGTPEQMKQRLADDTKRFSQLVKDAVIKLE